MTKAKNTAEAAFLALVFSGKNSILTAKDTKIYDNDFSELRVSLENACAGTIWATYWHEASVILAKAGIHPPSVAWPGLRRHDESRERPCGAGCAAISNSLDECHLMDTSW